MTAALSHSATPQRPFATTRRRQNPLSLPSPHIPSTLPVATPRGPEAVIQDALRSRIKESAEKSWPKAVAGFDEAIASGEDLSCKLGEEEDVKKKDRPAQASRSHGEFTPRRPKAPLPLSSILTRGPTGAFASGERPTSHGYSATLFGESGAGELSQRELYNDSEEEEEADDAGLEVGNNYARVQSADKSGKIDVNVSLGEHGMQRDWGWSEKQGKRGYVEMEVDA
ncbi:hypothetical protein M427DRAFT_58947 [Gonapodya prolifera JEL478]|uniref:Uncharacterized protein n=1 Tax=Gonapodya prolifera (strain JEL478) TaxID=1344416 RepID=A0A139A8M0_GONPJ|nr:hypothetical protein M427DRAFT_58947 [Gonapodya prolifera JEL478]|eukprot:KXS13028.1 hypothetical protein M427DRAFT_58947 [Gonapodya prolifera JEL478]